jgi:hypothetical protein
MEESLTSSFTTEEFDGEPLAIGGNRFSFLSSFSTSLV